MPESEERSLIAVGWLQLTIAVLPKASLTRVVASIQRSSLSFKFVAIVKVFVVFMDHVFSDDDWTILWTKIDSLSFCRDINDMNTPKSEPCEKHERWVWKHYTDSSRWFQPAKVGIVICNLSVVQKSWSKNVFRHGKWFTAVKDIIWSQYCHRFWNIHFFLLLNNLRKWFPIADQTCSLYKWTVWHNFHLETFGLF